MENRIELEDLSAYSSDDLAEGYFGADEYSEQIKEKIKRYQVLKEKPDLTEEEHIERAQLFQNIPFFEKQSMPLHFLWCNQLWVHIYLTS